MAIHVIAGIPWLAGVLGTLFATVFAFFTKFLTKRLALVGAAVAVIVGLSAAMFAAINAAASAIIPSIPDDIVTGASLVVPSNLSACAAAYISAHLLYWAYSWNVRVVQMKLF